jgi:hypothetical protein
LFHLGCNDDRTHHDEQKLLLLHILVYMGEKLVEYVNCKEMSFCFVALLPTKGQHSDYCQIPIGLGDVVTFTEGALI